MSLSICVTLPVLLSLSLSLTAVQPWRSISRQTMDEVKIGCDKSWSGWRWSFLWSRFLSTTKMVIFLTTKETFVLIFVCKKTLISSIFRQICWGCPLGKYWSLLNKYQSTFFCISYLHFLPSLCSACFCDSLLLTSGVSHTAFQKCRRLFQLLSPDLGRLWCSLWPVFCWLMNEEQALCDWSCTVKWHLLLRRPFQILKAWQTKSLLCAVCRVTVCMIECRCTAWPPSFWRTSLESNLSKCSCRSDLVSDSCPLSLRTSHVCKNTHDAAREQGTLTPQLYLYVKSVPLTGYCSQVKNTVCTSRAEEAFFSFPSYKIIIKIK